MRIAVTGATGYIGRRFVKISESRGHEIVAVTRRSPPNHTGIWIPFDISAFEHIVLPTRTAAIVHLAADILSTGREDVGREIEVAKSLIRSSRESGAKFIFVSSQTARVDAPTSYGRTKWLIEREVLAAGGWVVRPGQVYGGDMRGLFGVLVKLVKQLPALPLFLPAPKIQPIHVDDLSEGLIRIVERDDLPSAVYCLAAPEPVTFSAFLGEIARSRLRIWRGSVPAPVIVINAVARILGKSLSTRLGLERLSSLFDLPYISTKKDLELLGLTLRPLSSGLNKSGSNRRRLLLQEGKAILSYVLKLAPGNALLRRYVRAIEGLRAGTVLGLPNALIRHPILLALIDRPERRDQVLHEEFNWRLNAATLLAEATPSGADRFLGIGRTHGVFRSLTAITYAVSREVLWRILRTLLSPLIRSEVGRKEEAK